MASFDVSLYEPIHPPWSADSTAITADSVLYTADGGPLVGAADIGNALVNAGFISAQIVEPIGSVWTADRTDITADSIIFTADGSPIQGARDTTDAQVISAIIEVPGGGIYPRPLPRPIIGYGYGILPELKGEAVGAIGIIGRGLGKLSHLSGVAEGAQGSVATGAASISDLLIVGDGVTGSRGSASGTIMKLDAIAIGQHDDDELALITFLLAA